MLDRFSENSPAIDFFAVPGSLSLAKIQVVIKTEADKEMNANMETGTEIYAAANTIYITDEFRHNTGTRKTQTQAQAQTTI